MRKIYTILKLIGSMLLFIIMIVPMIIALLVFNIIEGIRINKDE